ncbi:GL10972 [Drosophila persimilis]|uniref:GL10972 n=1 Tax=Drosophila persimilis TaxID=7234 RepID=B4GC95_DROPE|nr:GL10972 [Drosophila persimilis]
MAMEWITAMDKRPCDRNLRDVELISCRLRRVEPLCRLPGSALQQLAMCGFYEDLEKGVTLFRAGEQGRFWYAVLGGSLEVRYHAHADADGKGLPFPRTRCISDVVVCMFNMAGVDWLSYGGLYEYGLSLLWLWVLYPSKRTVGKEETADNGE